MSGRLENEVVLLEQYEKDVNSLIEQLIEADPKEKKRLQKEIERRFEIYRKQIDFVKAQFPESNEGQMYESSYLTSQAMAKVFSAGLMRRMSAGSKNFAVGLATGLIAKQQEKTAVIESIGLIDKAISILDHAGPHLLKARLLHDALGQKETALRACFEIHQNPRERVTSIKPGARAPGCEINQLTEPAQAGDSHSSRRPLNQSLSPACAG
ncbi:MAG TPA: hypothetical protein VEF04_19960 [Blastocatellia bacterium]|nr:hypothetical protein [Blastocatellia bacterium]